MLQMCLIEGLVGMYATKCVLARRVPCLKLNTGMEVRSAAWSLYNGGLGPSAALATCTLHATRASLGTSHPSPRTWHLTARCCDYCCSSPHCSSGAAAGRRTAASTARPSPRSWCLRCRRASSATTVCRSTTRAAGTPSTRTTATSPCRTSTATSPAWRSSASSSRPSRPS